MHLCGSNFFSAELWGLALGFVYGGKEREEVASWLSGNGCPSEEY